LLLVESMNNRKRVENEDVPYEKVTPFDGGIDLFPLKVTTIKRLLTIGDVDVYDRILQGLIDHCMSCPTFGERFK